MTNHRGNFGESLALSHKCELVALAQIKKKYEGAFIREGYYKGHDIYIPEIRASVEVKCDLEASRTGNFAVEIYCNGNPSGVSTTDANKWFFFHDPTCYISITVNRLKELCRLHKNDQRDVYLDCPARVVLIPCLEMVTEGTLFNLSTVK